MFLIGEDKLVADWVYARTSGQLDVGVGTVGVGWVDSHNNLIAGVVFHSYTPGRNLFVDCAIEGKRFPPALLRFTLQYSFYQLKVARLTFAIDSVNLSSKRLVRRLGAIQEATLSGAACQGDLELWVLRPATSAFCRRFLNVKKRHSGPAGLLETAC